MFQIGDMDILGYLASLFIGITLGLIGGGGSILTLPILVYLFGIDAITASSYSLFIVGITSIIGSIAYMKNGLLDKKTAIVFGIPSILTVYLTRKFLLPTIPSVLFLFNTFHISKASLLLIVFAIIMLFAAYRMIKTEKETIEERKKMTAITLTKVIIQGILIGVITGLVGAGGGFLLIPALVVLTGLSMKKAIGTSLLIIAANSIVGFLGSTITIHINWFFLGWFSLIAICGVFIGTYFSKKINGKTLKPLFGWFVLAMGVFILFEELLK